MGSVRSKREVDTALRKKGFQRTVGGSHVLYALSGSSEITTLMSHGTTGGTLSAELIARMARQLRLTKAQFLALVDCTLNEEDYREILRNQEDAEEEG